MRRRRSERRKRRKKEGRKKEEEEKDLIKPVFKLELNHTEIFVKKKYTYSYFLNLEKSSNKGNALF